MLPRFLGGSGFRWLFGGSTQEQIPGIESLTPDDKAIITDLVALGRNPMRYVPWGAQ